MRSSVLALFVFGALARSAWATAFREWYPEYAPILQNTLETVCAAEYHAWAAGLPAPPDSYAANGTTSAGQAVVQCILSTTSEFMKSNMASAAVLLGIMPFALSVLGSSSEESALLYVIARRPLLTTLLLAGAPVVVALRPFEYKDPVGILRAREGRFYSFKLGPDWFVLLLEYTVALASVANVVHVTYGLSVGVTTIIMPDASYLPGLWAVTGIVVHVIGALCLKSRLKLLTPRDEPIVNAEFILSAKKNITVETIPENKVFLALSWLTSVTTTFHVIFGTLAFSSMQFISVRDAFGVIGRFTASVTICRVVLMYELSGLRSSVDDGTQEARRDGDGQDPTDSVKYGQRIFTFSP
ncbi:hypothetical protein N657DRAFT_640456 [Parathielavia appendiculata]|uniref:Uncharacterized protein n=1 Tax=Parathielavia appendiculata TaxID=2587402 RepID=A0AAN6UB82_9PEZI|nr:hypothetical protein N657DRAFT_640456 [Parathielavia appendiculata]